MAESSANPPISAARIAHPAASRAASHVVGWPNVSASSQHSSEMAAIRATYSGSWARSIASGAARTSLELGLQRGEEVDQPLLGLGMVMAPGRVEVRHGGMADGLDGAYTSLSRDARRSTPSSLGGPGACGPVGLEIGHVGQRRRGIERRDVLEHAELVGLRLEAPGGEHRLEIRVLMKQSRAGLRPDAAGAGDLVRRVAAQSNEVADLTRLDVVALTHLGRPDALQLADAANRLQDRHVVGRELERVAIGGRDERRASACALGRDRCREKVVGLESLFLAADDPGRRDESRQQVELVEDLGVELPSGLVGRRAARCGRWERRACPSRRRRPAAAPPARGAGAST